MIPTLTIEKALLKHERANPQRAGHDFFTKYALLHDRLTKVEYAQVMQGFAGGNDHGPQHILRVLEYLDALLGKNPAKVLGIYELFLAMMAVLYHDVGILLGRDRHADKSAYLLSLEKNDYVFDDIDKKYIAIAVRDHSSSKSIEADCEGYPEAFMVRGHTLRIRRVVALVRLADELDEDARRAPVDLEVKMRLGTGTQPPELGKEISELPDTALFFWAFNQRVLGVAPAPDRKQIAITMQFRPEDVTTKMAPPGKELQPFVRLAIEKILKINAERAYCNRFLPDGARYSQLELLLMPLGNDPTWTTPWVHTLGDATKLDELWAHLPVGLSSAAETPAAPSSTAEKPAALPAENSGDLNAERGKRRLAIWETMRDFEGTHSQATTNDLLRSLASIGALSPKGAFIPLRHVLAWVRFEWQPTLVLSVATHDSLSYAATPWGPHQSAAEVLVELEHNLYAEDVLGGRLEEILTEEIFDRLAELALLAAEVRFGPPPIAVGKKRAPTRTAAHPQVSKILAHPNMDWVVTEFGLECVLHSYPIEARRLKDPRWLVHMQEKTWVDIERFEEALDTAMHLHNLLDTNRA